MERLKLTYDGVRAMLADRSNWSELSVAEIARLLEFTLHLHGRTGEPELLDAIPALYALFADRVPTAARREIFARLSVFAREREIRRDALFAFLHHEDDPQIVSQAAADLALYHEPDGEEGVDGPGHVLSVVLRGGVTNPGAAIAGLLLLGDPDVCARLAPLRPILAKPELEHTLLQLVACASGDIHAATIAFYLDWLEELLYHGDKTQAFAHVASGLAIQRRSAMATQVIFGRRRFPLGLDGNAYESGSRTVPLGEFARSIAPRLDRLESLEPPPKMMTRVKEIWLAWRQEKRSIACEPYLH